MLCLPLLILVFQVFLYGAEDSAIRVDYGVPDLLMKLMLHSDEAVSEIRNVSSGCRAISVSSESMQPSLPPSNHFFSLAMVRLLS